MGEVRGFLDFLVALQPHADERHEPAAVATGFRQVRQDVLHDVSLFWQQEPRASFDF